MGFLSSLFGGNKKEKALSDAFGKVRRILEDEQFSRIKLDGSMPANFIRFCSVSANSIRTATELLNSIKKDLAKLSSVNVCALFVFI